MRESVEYFLRRLPVTGPSDDEPARKLLTQSLGAYRAKQSALWADFEARVERALEDRRSLISLEEPQAWEAIVASDMGVSLTLVGDLASAVAAVVEPMTTIDWINWFIRWLRGDVSRLYGLLEADELESLFKPRIGDRNASSTWHEEVLDSLHKLLMLWMGGTPLVILEDYLRPGGRQRMCYQARKFAIRVMPRISFAIGLIALTVRRKSETEETGEVSVPLALGTLAACAREGFDVPEKLALYFVVRQSRAASRVMIHELYGKLAQGRDLAGPNDESFVDMRDRIERLLVDYGSS